MAIVYAEMNELNAFQENIETTFAPLENVSTSQENLISDTKKKMEEALRGAEESERQAESTYYEAKQALSEAEARTAEYNSHLEEDQEPMTTSEYYYERVDECAMDMEYAVARRKRIEETIANFDDYCRKYHDEQSRLISQYKDLLRDSSTFFDKYISILIKAKEAILGDEPSCEGMYNAVHSGGTLTSSLEETDIQIIIAATGWDKETILKKCSKDGTVYTYRTVNADYENRLHTSGVFYERSKFEIDGVCFEGVFPKFNAVYEPKTMPRSLWNGSGNKYTTQFAYCNEQLRIDIAKNPTLAGQFTAVQLKQIAAGKTPSGYTWHHHQEPGRMQLVRKKEHNVATGGAGHTGGGALWCK